MIRRITHFTWRLFFWSLVFFAISISIVRLLILGIDGYKTDLENKIFELTSIPVEIGTLRANMRGINPEAVLKNITIVADKRDEQPIQLEEVRLGLDLGALFLTRKILPSSRLTLVGVKLSIIRNKDGSLSIVGLSGDGSEHPLWLLRGGQYEVLKSQITWVDKQRDAQPIVFDNVDLLIKNQQNKKTHELHLVSQLPEQLGKELRISLDIQGDILKADNIKGKVYLEAKDVYLTNYLKGFLPDKIKVTDGEEKARGSVKLWSHWDKSKLSSFSGIVQINHTTLHNQQKKIDIKLLKTEFVGVAQQEGWQLSVNHCDLETKKQRWPTAQFIFSKNKENTRLKSLITQLDLHELMMLVDFFAPLDKEKQTMVSKLGLKGLLKNFSFSVDLDNDKIQGNGHFENIFVNAYADIPQIENLSGTLKGNENKGEIKLNTKKGTLFFPKLLRKPVQVDDMKGQVEWQQNPNEWQIQTKSLVVDTKDIQTKTRLLLTIPKTEKPTFIDLRTSFSNVQDVSSLKAYYPTGVMKKKTINWLDNAFVSGQIKQGEILVYGELNHFPFLKGEGVFEALFDATEVEFNFSPDWPNLKHGFAEILFLKDGMTIDIKRANMQRLTINHAFVNIPSFQTSQLMFIKGDVKGSIASALSYLQKTPVNTGVDDFVSAIDVTGNTRVKLNLKVPLQSKAGKNTVAKINAVAHFKKAGLTIKSLDLNVKEVKGDLIITEKGLFSDNLTAKTLSYPISATVSHDDIKTTVNIIGKTDSIELKKQFSFLDYDFLKVNPFGEPTPYNITLDLPKSDNNTLELNLKSNLVGLSIDLPGRLKKLAEQEKPLLINMVLNEQGFLPLNISYGDELKAALHFNKQQNSVHSAQIVYGQQDAHVPKTKGIDVLIDQNVLDASEWGTFLGQSLVSHKESDIKFNLIILKTGQMLWNGKKQGAFELDLLRSEQQWNGGIVSSAAKGRFVIPHVQTETDKIKFTMDRINLSDLTQLRMQTDGTNEQEMPIIDVFSKQLWWDNVNLGSLEIEMEKTTNGAQFNRIDLISDKHKIKLKADWIKSELENVTLLYGFVNVDELGETLSQLNVTQDLKETEGYARVSVTWPGLPYLFSLETIKADLNVTLKNGRISSIEPGFGRLLGFLAMEQWVKRLTFDYSDMYKQGLSFNKIKGDFKVEKGKMGTNNLLVDAIPARISIKGEVDLLAKTLNHKVKVVPKSSAAIPIAGTIVGGIAGALTQAIDKNYEEGYFFGSKYNVTGKWDDIKVTPLDK
ncbi:MAG: TIGR02099 family protein [Methylococcales bacterium]|nr:TIGR02099 family protein [Methylococcales bacterium]